MKRFIIITILVLAAILLTGCQAERATVDISDGGKDLAAPAPAAAVTAEEPAIPDEQPEEEPPAAEPAYVTLSFEGQGATAAVESICFEPDGRLAVTVTGSGYAFNKVLPLRNGKIIVPFSADLRTGGKTRPWDTVNFSEGTIKYLYDVSELPDEVILYSTDNEDEQFVFDAAPYIRSDLSAPEQEDADASLPSGTDQPLPEDGAAAGEDTAAETRPESIQWLSYRLSLEELREMEDSDGFSVNPPEAGYRYMVAKLVSTDGEIETESITEQTLGTIALKDPSGRTYTPAAYTIWGVGFDVEKGFYTKELQEGFRLLFKVPEDVAPQQLTVTAG